MEVDKLKNFGNLDIMIQFLLKILVLHIILLAQEEGRKGEL